MEAEGGDAMATRKSSRVNRKYKTKYRIRNWREYERGLRSRGDVTIWLSEKVIAAWTPPKNGLRGGQRRYSNLEILIALTLRVVDRVGQIASDLGHERFVRIRCRPSIQGLSTEPLGLRGESPSLHIRQPELAAFQLFLQNPVLFDQVGGDVLLVAVHPPRYGKEQHLKRVEIGSHWRILPAPNSLL